MPTYDVWNAPDVVDQDDLDDLDDDFDDDDVTPTRVGSRWTDSPPPNSKTSAASPDWEAAWEDHLAKLGKDELAMPPVEIEIMAMAFHDEFTKQQIAAGTLTGAEAQASRRFDPGIASARERMEAATPGSAAHLDAHMELGKLETERAAAVLVAPFEGKSRDQIRREVREHKVTAENLLEKFDALDERKYPERRRTLRRKIMAERLAAARAETADQLRYIGDQQDAIDGARQRHEKRAAELKKAVEVLQGKVEDIDAQFRRGGLAWDVVADLKGERAALVEKIDMYQGERRRHSTAGWGEESRRAVSAIRK
jgi:hypothetical protein